MILTEFQEEVDYKDLQYLLAAEDYHVFHDFMHEANKSKNARALKNKVQAPVRKTQEIRKTQETKQPQPLRESEDDRMMRLAIEASLAETRNSKLDRLSMEEQEQERLAL